jgi:hypothetical protein
MTDNTQLISKIETELELLKEATVEQTIVATPAPAAAETIVTAPAQTTITINNNPIIEMAIKQAEERLAKEKALK